MQGVCDMKPVAEVSQVIQSPLRGEIVTWRGFCTDHLQPLWVEDDAVYRWVLKSAGQSRIPFAHSPV